MHLDLRKLASISIFKHALNTWSARCCSYQTEGINYSVYSCSFGHYLHYLHFILLHLHKCMNTVNSDGSPRCSVFAYFRLTCAAVEFLFRLTLRVHWNVLVHKEWVKPVWLFSVTQRHVTPTQSVSAYMLCTLGRTRCLFVPYRFITS